MLGRKSLHVNSHLGRKVHIPKHLGRKIARGYYKASEGLDKAATLAGAVAPGAAILAPEFAPVILGTAAALKGANAVNKSGRAIGDHVHDQRVAKREQRRNAALTGN